MTDICFLWLAGAILGLRGQLFVHKSSAAGWMLLVLAGGAGRGDAAALVHPVNLSVRAEDEIPVTARVTVTS